MHNFLYCLLYFFKQRKTGRRKSLHTFQFKNPFVFLMEKRKSVQELKLLLFIQQMLYIDSYGGKSSDTAEKHITRVSV